MQTAIYSGDLFLFPAFLSGGGGFGLWDCLSVKQCGWCCDVLFKLWVWVTLLFVWPGGYHCSCDLIICISSFRAHSRTFVLKGRPWSFHSNGHISDISVWLWWNICKATWIILSNQHYLNLPISEVLINISGNTSLKLCCVCAVHCDVVCPVSNTIAGMAPSQLWKLTN